MKPCIRYLAGYFDGEGSIIFSKQLRLELCVSSCNPRGVSLLFKAFGGKVTEVEQVSKGVLGRHYFRWRIYGQGARTALRRLYPHLREKQKQAQIALDCFKCGDAASRRETYAQLKTLKHIHYVGAVTHKHKHRNENNTTN